PHAPRMITLQVPVDKIGLVIGPGGKTIRGFEQDLEVKIDVEDDGLVKIFGEDAENVEEVRSALSDMTRDVELGEIFTGEVVTITDFGAFVEVLPGRDGLLHISDIEHSRTNKVEDVLKMGDKVTCKVTEVEEGGKIKLSRKALLNKDGSLKEGVKEAQQKQQQAEQKAREEQRKREEEKKQEQKPEPQQKQEPKQEEKPEPQQAEPQKPESVEDTGPTAGAYFREKKR
ncbi:MAG: S1 RNA-binding domain-containing protein, partial [Armatimonadota bacterium]